MYIYIYIYTCVCVCVYIIRVCMCVKLCMHIHMCVQSNAHIQHTNCLWFLEPDDPFETLAQSLSWRNLKVLCSY